MGVLRDPVTSDQRAATAAAAASGATALIGAVGIAGQLAGRSLLPDWPPGSTPMALWVALALFILGAGLLVLVLRPDRAPVRTAVAVAAAGVTGAALLTTVASITGWVFDLETLSPFRQLSRLPVPGPRSTGPLGGPTIGFAAVGLLLLAIRRGRTAVGGLGLLTLLFGLGVSIGFLYASPLLQSPNWRPVALAAALAATSHGLALVAAAGPSAWPLRTVTGPTVRAQLLRWFLPFTVLVVLFTDLLTVNFFSRFSPAIGSVLNTIVSLGGAAAVIYYVAGIIGSRLDRAETRLATSEVQFRSLIENSSDLTTICDGNGTVSYVSPSVEGVLGFKPDERVGRSIFELIHPDDVARVRQALEETLKPGSRPDPAVICRLRDKQGRWRVVEAAGWNMLSISGVAGIAIHSRDVTDRQALEEQLRQAQKMETVGQLAGGIAHDFNNMLSVIMANTDLVAAAAPGAEDELRDVRDAADRGKAMVKQLMTFSRVGNLELKPTDFGPLAERTGRMLKRMLPASISVGVKPERDVPAAVADPGAVEQMVLNLATNARDAMPSGGRLEIAVRKARGTDLGAENKANPADYVCLAVTDTGTGMDDVTLRRVFEPFFTTKPPGRGTGLGMAMVSGLMSQHGGYVHITSEVGKGTCIRLCFPVAKESVKAAEAAKTTDANSLRGTEWVLVVDDEDALRRVAQRILEKHGYRVITAQDGESALQLLRNGGVTPDLIMADMIMPNMGGAELFQRVTQEFGARRFLLASGYNPGETADGQTLLTTVPFIKKPWTLNEMLEGVRKVLDDKGR